MGTFDGKAAVVTGERGSRTIRRRMAVAAAVVGLGLGTLGVGGAQAQGNGVGRNDGTTGKARACQAHAENKGKSVAKGLECAPAATLVVICRFVGYEIVGSGLLPGSTVTLNGVVLAQQVDASGNYQFFVPIFGTVTVQGTTASGDPISYTATCGGAA